MQIFGFTLLRNGVKYDYPFVESLLSLSGLVEKTYLALGDSEDETNQRIQTIPNLKITPTVWDENKRKGGHILSEQTNIALDALRADHKSGWAFYLQCDEVISEESYEQIREDMKKAEQAGCNAISFRYLHFWQRYDAIAISWRCYPQEIRAIRVDSDLKSYGDAQSFEGNKKVYFSDVPIFHYGHVREAKAYELKKWDFGKWWHSDAELAKVLKKGEKKTVNEITVKYLGPHPKVMEKRIELRQNAQKKKVLVIGDPHDYSKNFLDHVQAKLDWHAGGKINYQAFDDVVMLKDPGFLHRLFSFGKIKSQVPTKMHSPEALEWNAEFLALLRFSEKDIPVNYLPVGDHHE